MLQISSKLLKDQRLQKYIDKTPTNQILTEGLQHGLPTYQILSTARQV